MLAPKIKTVNVVFRVVVLVYHAGKRVWPVCPNAGV